MSRASWWTTLTADELIRLHRRVLHSIGAKFSSQLGSEVEDVVQEGFVALFSHRDTIRSENDGVYRYWWVAARNRALDRLKKKETRAGKPPPPRKAAEVASPASQMDRLEKNEAIQKIFCELNQLDRFIIWCRVVDGRSVQSIAREVDLDWHRVANTIDRVLEQFRRQLLD